MWGLKAVSKPGMDYIYRKDWELNYYKTPIQDNTIKNETGKMVSVTMIKEWKIINCHFWRLEKNTSTFKFSNLNVLIGNTGQIEQLSYNYWINLFLIIK